MNSYLGQFFEQNEISSYSFMRSNRHMSPIRMDIAPLSLRVFEKLWTEKEYYNVGMFVSKKLQIFLSGEIYKAGEKNYLKDLKLKSRRFKPYIAEINPPLRQPGYACDGLKPNELCKMGKNITIEDIKPSGNGYLIWA